MSILRIATSRADITTFGGVMTTDGSKFDNTRVAEAYQLAAGKIASLGFDAAAGTTSWLHWVVTVDIAAVNQTLYDQPIATVRDAGSNDIFQMQLDNTLMSFFARGDTVVESGGTLIPNGTPITVDVEIIVTGTTDIRVSAYVGGALQFQQTVLNTLGKTNPTSLEISNPIDAVEPTVYGSEIIVADEDTRGFRLRELKPQSFGVFKQWDGTVASVVDDSLATGVSTDVLNERVSFGLSNLDNISGGDIINRIVIQSHAQRGASGLASMNHFFRYEGGTTQDGADISLGLFGEWYMDEYLTNPDTAATWLPADLAGIQMGVRART